MTAVKLCQTIKTFSNPAADLLNRVCSCYFQKKIIDEKTLPTEDDSSTEDAMSTADVFTLVQDAVTKASKTLASSSDLQTNTYRDYGGLACTAVLILYQAFIGVRKYTAAKTAAGANKADATKTTAGANKAEGQNNAVAAEEGYAMTMAGAGDGMEDHFGLKLPAGYGQYGYPPHPQEHHHRPHRNSRH